MTFPPVCTGGYSHSATLVANSCVQRSVWQVSFFTLVNILRLNSRRTIKLIDQKLIEECRRGNLENFRKLVEASAAELYSVVFRMTGDEEKARDIIQETMITMWQKIGDMKSVEAYSSWVKRIAINKCYDEIRRSKSNPEVNADERTWSILAEGISDGYSLALENKEIAAVIRMLTDRLSPRQKTVFILADIEGMSSDEISVATGMSKVLIKANLHYARKKISELVEKYI